ncbi:hypothetical protein E6H36_05045 [Candidatus Bathyarchaeota archaeon]|nr:MAG: hypothetical protein E6H36_05045 [Candidatus Bathyarchaeota archaeon]TMI30517.1 MAG: hypothetical protein E6H29_08220 [Candidatus Bathyarchaeota archaeon]
MQASSCDIDVRVSDHPMCQGQLLMGRWLLALYAVALLAISFSSANYHIVFAASSNTSARDVTLYWHYANSQVSVGGIRTNYVLNSTPRFDFQTQTAARQRTDRRTAGNLLNKRVASSQIRLLPCRQACPNAKFGV